MRRIESETQGIRTPLVAAFALLAVLGAPLSAWGQGLGEAVDQARVQFYKDGNARAALAMLDQSRKTALAVADKGDRLLALAEIGLAQGEIQEASNNKKGAEKLFSEAKGHAESAIDAGERGSEAYRILADASMRVIPYRNMVYKMRHGTEPRGMAEKAIALDAKNRRAFLSLGQFYLFCPPAFGGSKAKAYDNFRKFAAMGDDDLGRFLGLMWQGISLREMGRGGEAATAFARAGQIFPQSPWPGLERAKK